jgi:hypothetical protein
MEFARYKRTGLSIISARVTLFCAYRDRDRTMAFKGLILTTKLLCLFGKTPNKPNTIFCNQL